MDVQLILIFPLTLIQVLAISDTLFLITSIFLLILSTIPQFQDAKVKRSYEGDQYLSMDFISLITSQQIKLYNNFKLKLFISNTSTLLLNIF